MSPEDLDHIATIKANRWWNSLTPEQRRRVHDSTQLLPGLVKLWEANAAYCDRQADLVEASTDTSDVERGEYHQAAKTFRACALSLDSHLLPQ